MKNIHQKKVEEKIAADEEEKRKIEEQKVFLSDFYGFYFRRNLSGRFSLYFFFKNRTAIYILIRRILLLIFAR